MKKLLLLLSVLAALNLHAGDVTVGVWLPIVPLNEKLMWTLQSTVSWTSGDVARYERLGDRIGFDRVGAWARRLSYWR